MKIAIIGAMGDVGRRIVGEALSRGHRVSALVRSQSQFGKLSALAAHCAVDVSDTEQTARAIAGHDIVISAVRPPDGQEDLLVDLTRSVLDAAMTTGTRALIVGGASRLKLPDGGGATVLTAPGFLPAPVVPIARACQRQYELCLNESLADWTYLSPPAMLEPGVRTGHYQLGTDTLVTAHDGVSRISMEDFAVALLDEAEAPKHAGRAFTVG